MPIMPISCNTETMFQPMDRRLVASCQTCAGESYSAGCELSWLVEFDGFNQQKWYPLVMTNIAMEN